MWNWYKQVSVQVSLICYNPRSASNIVINILKTILSSASRLKRSGPALYFHSLKFHSCRFVIP